MACLPLVQKQCGLRKLFVVQRGRMPIHLGALRGQVDVIARLCDHGALLSALEADGAAPLHKALGQGHVEAAHQLIMHGAEASQALEVQRPYAGS